MNNWADHSRPSHSTSPGVDFRRFDDGARFQGELTSFPPVLLTPNGLSGSFRISQLHPPLGNPLRSACGRPYFSQILVSSLQIRVAKKLDVTDDGILLIVVANVVRLLLVVAEVST
jgi:hypothetical protein